MYAVIRSGNKQYRVAPGDTVRVERLPGKVGAKVTFDDVLAVHTGEKKLVTGAGASKAAVTGKIIRQGRGPKLHVFNFLISMYYNISRCHRQNYSSVQVSDIKL